MDALDLLISRSLAAFVQHIRDTGWQGRENEAVSLYAFGFLLQECRSGGPLREPTQVGIEIAVPPNSTNRTKDVRKDLVIWRHPGHNLWYPPPPEPRSEPMAIVEWEVRRRGYRSDGSHHDRDVKWLTEQCESHPETTGYAVLLDLRPLQVQLLVDRLHSGGVQRWEL